MPSLIACPQCENHAKLTEAQCPHCGAALRDRTGQILRSATAGVLGLVAVGCSPSAPAPGPAVAEYGPPPTADVPVEPAPVEPSIEPTATPSASASGAVPPEAPPVAEYGPPPTEDPVSPE